MAQSGTPDSANSQFFFNLVNNASSLDSQKFAVFGTLVDASSQAALTALTNDSVNNESTSAFAKPGLLVNTFPLAGFSGGNNDPNITTDAKISNLMVLNSVTIDKQDEVLKYTIVSNDNSALVTASLQNERLTLTKGTGTAHIVVRATDKLGASVTQSITVNVT